MWMIIYANLLVIMSGVTRLARLHDLQTMISSVTLKFSFFSLFLTVVFLYTFSATFTLIFSF